MHPIKLNFVNALLILSLLGFTQSCEKRRDKGQETKTNQNISDSINDAEQAQSSKINNSNVRVFTDREGSSSRNPIKVDGIVISADLFVNWSNKTDRISQLTTLIKQSLKKDKVALIELTEFDCGGGAGCYDLGSIIVQVIYRIGEKNAVNTFLNHNADKALRLRDLIAAGLEYGDNNYDDKMDNKLIENEFPDLHKLLSEKQ